jgi:Kef-type K+ transport system membrane component KefB
LVLKLTSKTLAELKSRLLAALGGFFVPFTLGYLIMVWYGESRIAALFVAIAMGVTSLATKSRILVDLKLLNTRVAYVLMAGALISDTLALIIFAGITSFTDLGRFDLSLSLKLLSGQLPFLQLQYQLAFTCCPNLDLLCHGRGLAAALCSSPLFFL